MKKLTDIETKIVTAAFTLAENRSWRDVRLGDIAGETGLSLIELAEEVADKTAILQLYGRDIDRKMLLQLADHPVSGDSHDRLFDVMMMRLEIMEPQRKAIANIIQQPGDGPADWAGLLATIIRSQGWILAAAGLDDGGNQNPSRGIGLAVAFYQVLKVWVQDDDPGKAQTMAALDRKLRDGVDWMKKLEAPVALVNALVGLARRYFSDWQKQAGNTQNKAPEAQPDAASDSILTDTLPDDKQDI